MYRTALIVHFLASDVCPFCFVRDQDICPNESLEIHSLPDILPAVHSSATSHRQDRRHCWQVLTAWQQQSLSTGAESSSAVLSLRVTHTNESIGHHDPRKIFADTGEPYPFLSSIDHCPAGYVGRDDTKRR